MEELKEKIKWCFVEMNINGTKQTELNLSREELELISDLLDENK